MSELEDWDESVDIVPFRVRVNIITDVFLDASETDDIEDIVKVYLEGGVIEVDPDDIKDVQVIEIESNNSPI